MRFLWGSNFQIVMSAAVATILGDVAVQPVHLGQVVWISVRNPMHDISNGLPMFVLWMLSTLPLTKTTYPEPACLDVASANRPKKFRGK
jgi:hypothetical protein